MKTFLKEIKTIIIDSSYQSNHAADDEDYQLIGITEEIASQTIDTGLKTLFMAKRNALDCLYRQKIELSRRLVDIVNYMNVIDNYRSDIASIDEAIKKVNAQPKPSFIDSEFNATRTKWRGDDE